MKKINADYYTFSGHKMLGPTGTGILYGKKEHLEQLPPFLLGGETVSDSTYEQYTLKPLPHKLEAGLQDYAGIIGLQAAITYLKKIGMHTIEKHETKINTIITEELEQQPLTIIGPQEAQQRGNIYSFMIDKMDIHNAAHILNKQNIMVRSGAHCVHAWFNKKQLPGSIRASFYIYNTEEEAQQFATAIKKIIQLT